MKRNDEGLAAEFPAVDEATWRRRVEAELGEGALADLVRRLRSGVSVQPLYTSEAGLADPAGFPRTFPFTRGEVRRPASGWEIVAGLPAGSAEAAAAAAAEAVDGGADALALSLDSAGVEGVAVDDLDTLHRTLAGVDLARVTLHLDGRAVGPALVPALLALCRRRGGDARRLRGSVADDPVAAWCRTGRLDGTPSWRYRWLADVHRELTDRAPELKTLVVSGYPFREAGGHGVREMALMLAAAAEVLRGVIAARGDVRAAGSGMLFVTGVGREIFPEMARLRALRACWARMVQAAGGGHDGSAAIHARSLLRRRSRRDPWTNLLRGTQETFIGALGGARWITVLPYDAALDEPGSQGLRLARQTQLILREESHLGRLTDPAGGSGVIEALTREQARAAWDMLQAIESEGGLWARIASGRLREEIEADASSAAEQVATGRMSVTGVNTFPLLDEAAPGRSGGRYPAARRTGCPPPARELLARVAAQAADENTRGLLDLAVAALEAGAGLEALAAALAGRGGAVEGTGLEVRREGAAFEALRDRADAWFARHGHRPRVFLAALGTLREVIGPSDWVRNFFAAGGIESVGAEPAGEVEAVVEAYRSAPETVAVICTTPERRGVDGPALVAALARAGAGRILVAGRPGKDAPALGAAGAAGFVHRGCDAPAVLSATLDFLEGGR
ncbi:MAG: methylmalonyl-CoA mutase family protein [Acidobacteriota bacterium]|nr:methylmalonyl-CoA mutase family protein [Acidobacteriota bacterium]